MDQAQPREAISKIRDISTTNSIEVARKVNEVIDAVNILFSTHPIQRQRFEEFQHSRRINEIRRDQI